MAYIFDRRIISYLKEWKHKKDRKPLVLRGARQVGKTSAVLIFAKESFSSLIHLNLENPEHSRLFKEDVSLADFEKIIQIKFHQNIIAGQTLIFIDEIQNCPCLIKLLRFFYEERPDLHVVAAGSLLEVKIERAGFSLPVGRVEYAYLYPLDFFEYLEAKKENELLSFLKSVSLDDKIPDGIHQEALSHFYEYAMIGGMPEIVRVYLEEKNTDRIKPICSSLFTSYVEDLYKYSTQADIKYLSFVIENAPLFAGSTITYEKFGGSNFRSREMANAFSVLEKVMLVYQIQATKSKELPLIGQNKRPKKLMFLDVGLVNHQMGIQEEYLGLKDLNSLYRGRIAEQITGQNILAQFTDSHPVIYYWAKDKAEGSAEIDFCLHRNGRVLGIEVKSGMSKKLRSIFSFTEAVKNSLCVRCYSGTLKNEKIRMAGKSVMLTSVPFYLVPRILDIPFSK